MVKYSYGIMLASGIYQYRDELVCTEKEFDDWWEANKEKVVVAEYEENGLLYEYYGGKWQFKDVTEVWF